MKQDQRIQIAFDPAFIRTSMELWRETTDMKIPVHDSFKVHFMQNRGAILRNFAKTAGAWTMMFHGLEATSPEDAEALAAVRAEVEAFGEWAKLEIAKLERVAEEEALRTGLDEAFLSPEFQSLFKHFGQKPPGGKA